jgi:hypothetical protein
VAPEAVLRETGIIPLDATTRTVEVERGEGLRDHRRMSTARRAPLTGRELIALAQQLARDAEHHAILSAALASQADRLMHAGLRSLDQPVPPRTPPRVQP